MLATFTIGEGRASTRICITNAFDNVYACFALYDEELFTFKAVAFEQSHSYRQWI
jgi:hypothetical protein